MLLYYTTERDIVTHLGSKKPVIRQQTDFKRWKRSVSYRQRWMAETVFSSIKRTFGEYVTARKFQKELILKASLYNMFATMM
jgi:hypothetical protein